MNERYKPMVIAMGDGQVKLASSNGAIMGCQDIANDNMERFIKSCFAKM